MPYDKMPPQAYTKETLQEAFEWWSEQPDEFRSQIQDKDDLIGYYLRTNRGGAAREPKKEGGFTKAAKESFSSELKGLVKNLDTFEGYEARKGEHKDERTSFSAMKTVAQETSPIQHHAPAYIEAPPVKKHIFEPAAQMQFPEMSKPLVPERTDDVMKAGAASLVPTPVTKSKGQFFKLDSQSQASVSKARELLNLSSDEEALRALIALGRAKVKGLF